MNEEMEFAGEIPTSDAIALANAMRLRPQNAESICGDVLERISPCLSCGKWHDGEELFCSLRCSIEDRQQRPRAWEAVQARKRDWQREYSQSFREWQKRNKANRRTHAARLRGRIF